MSEYPPAVDWSRILKEIQANIETAYRAGLQAGRESANIAGDTERKAVALLDEATVTRGIIDCTTGTPIVRRFTGKIPENAKCIDPHHLVCGAFDDAEFEEYVPEPLSAKEQAYRDRLNAEFNDNAKEWGDNIANKLAEEMRRTLWCEMIGEASATRGIVDCTTGTPIVRRVLGTLPVTADECVMGDGAEVFNTNGVRVECDIRIAGPVVFSPDTMTHETTGYEACETFSTPEAALAARGGGQ
jgi:hypothetical protein